MDRLASESSATPGLRVAADGRGSFGVLSCNASRIELVLLPDPGPCGEPDRFPLERVDGCLWWTEVPIDVRGRRYAFRADGPRRPDLGHRFDPGRLLLDPWAVAVAGRARHEGGGGLRSLALAVDADGESERRAKVPWADTVLYEAHVRGLTRLHPGVPEGQRGTYLGLAADAVVEHLLGLGVTTLELLPVQQFVSEPRLVAGGLSNYWGYNPVAPLAPHGAYASRADGRQVEELREAVRRLHRAGLEVVLDLVLNHTAEGPLSGPTFGLRGLDNASYYRHQPTDPARYLDVTGCGNTLDASNAVGHRLLLDCLRHWATVYGVDGFRLDLAPALARGPSAAFDPDAPLFRAIRRDPLLADLKWIAEPWDLGPGGYRLGDFPPPFRQWNDRYRDAARHLWRGAEDGAAELVRRQLGSHDLLGPGDEPRSVDYITSHDGFTLADLTSYSRRHNEANGEANQDGHRHEISDNHGVEGASTDPVVRRSRRRTRLGLLATLALTRGVPMLSHGDEVGRSQDGNNNAYCHDGPLTWVDWRSAAEDDLRASLAALLRLRREHGPVREELAAADLAIVDAPDTFAAFRLESGAVALLNASREDLAVPTLQGAAVLFDGGERLAPGSAFPGRLAARSALVLAPTP
jgi:glycogen operon protein